MTGGRLRDRVVLPSMIEERAGVEESAKSTGQLRTVSCEVVGAELIHGHEHDEGHGGTGWRGCRRSRDQCQRQRLEHFHILTCSR